MTNNDVLITQYNATVDALTGTPNVSSVALEHVPYAVTAFDSVSSLTLPLSSFSFDLVIGKRPPYVTMQAKNVPTVWSYALSQVLATYQVPSYNLTGVILDPDNFPLTFVLSGLDPTSGLLPTSDNLCIQGVASQVGTWTVTLTATNTVGQSASFSITVEIVTGQSGQDITSSTISDITVAPDVISTVTLPVNTFVSSVGLPLSYNATVLDPSGQSHALPSWIAFNASLPLTFSFDASPSVVGSTTIIQVTAYEIATGKTASQTFSASVRYPTTFSINQIITIIIAGVVAVIVLVVFLIMHYKWPKAENVVIVTTALFAFDLATDIAFVWSLTQMDASLQRYLFTSVAFVSGSTVINFIAAVFFLGYISGVHGRHIRENNGTVAFVALASLIHIEIMYMLNSHLFYMDALSIDWSNDVRDRLKVLGLIDVLLRNTPMIAIQLAIILTTGNISVISLLSLASSALSVFYGFLQRLLLWFLMRRDAKQHTDSSSIEMTVRSLSRTVQNQEF